MKRASLSKNFLRIACTASMLILSGCAVFSEGNDQDFGKTLADLQPAPMPEVNTQVPSLSIDDIEASYHRALAVAETEEVRRKILIRLAGLEMIRSEQAQLDASERGQFFNTAVSMYRELIELQAGRPGRDKLIYQLAKAYALDGRARESAEALDQLAREYPDSPYIAEAEFRRAERAFADGDYAAAEAHYGAVVASGSDSPFADNARYMQGWAQFKRNHYEQALETFTRVLDGSVEEFSSLDSVEGPQKNLVDDTLRVMSLIFSYLDGADSIVATYARLGSRPYEYLLYQQLGGLYLEKKRYLDSAETFSQFIAVYPNSDYAPGFAVRIVDVYDQGDFPSQLLPAKENFVTAYGINSSYWLQKPGTIRDYLRPYLHTYLQELATYSHSQAQDEGLDAGEKSLHYKRAARWYEEFVHTFPADEKTPEMLFLLGEAYYESKQLPEAIRAYERVAYEFADPARGANAGYVAIIAADELIASRPADEQLQWRQRRTDSAISFADYYPEDARAPSVLASAAQDLLARNELVQAIAAAERLSTWKAPIESQLLTTAWLVIGQAQFDLRAFAKSEQAYRQVLSRMPDGSRAEAGGPSREQVVERIAASMFKQAEQQVATGNKAAAVDLLLRLTDFAPQSDIAVNADYDAASYLMELENWTGAERQLREFRRKYPQLPLTATLPAKLVVVYQALENWDAAAGELQTLAENDDDPEVRRQSLILSAELYERAENVDDAILAYRAYANRYSTPFNETLEAANKLVELYSQTGDDYKRDFWRRKIIGLDAGAGENRSERSRYLAASAASALADQVYSNYVRLPLTLPLKPSLDRKRKAMEETLDAYSDILDYGIAEFTTLASYRIGDVYVQLSRALLDSERPDNLDALELEQYQILLEEQAFPFEERAIEILESNARRSWNGLYDGWVKESFERLATLLPARYRKQEQVVEFSNAIQ